jgi:hypothetical protein
LSVVSPLLGEKSKQKVLEIKKMGRKKKKNQETVT